jgi:autotransporter-associated beta strand protein
VLRRSIGGLGRLSMLAALVTVATTAGSAWSQEQFLDNGSVRIGVDLGKGGGIVAFQPAGPAGAGLNVVNSHDLGRDIQQSYYAGPAQFHPADTVQSPKWSPWPWNPVQAGDTYGNRATLLDWSNRGGELYVKSRPKQWALQNVDAECTFEQWITLSGSAAIVRNRLTNARRDTAQHRALDQELPAAYTWAKLTRLTTYAGTRPFTGGALTVIPNAGPPWTSFRATEGWAAFVDDDEWGLGVFVPGTVRFIGGFAGTVGVGGTSSTNTGYIAPVRTEVLDHDIVYDFTYHLILGTTADIRGYALAHRPDLEPDHRFQGTRSGWTYGGSASDSGFPLTDRLHVLVAGTDPQMWGPECTFQAEDVPTLHVRAAFGLAAGTAPTATFSWERDNGREPTSDTQSKAFAVIADGQFHTYEVDMTTAAAWRGQISRLRFDPVPSGAAGDFMDIQCIAASAPRTVFIDVAAGTLTQEETRNAVLDGAAGVTKTGTGTLMLTASNAFTGPTRVTAGRLDLAHASALSSSTVWVAADATLGVAAAVRARIGGLDTSGGGRIDVGTGLVTVASGMTAEALRELIVEGRSGGTWAGSSGITSSAVAADVAAGRERAVGWIDNGDGSLTFGFASPGDTNLDGTVDAADAGNVARAGKVDTGESATWAEGDFNYDGVVDVLDAAAITGR